MKLYKYTNCEYGINNLEKGCITYSLPSSFNDVFDSRTAISKRNMKKTISMIIDGEVELKAVDVYRNYVKSSPKANRFVALIVEMYDSKRNDAYKTKRYKARFGMRQFKAAYYCAPKRPQDHLYFLQIQEEERKATETIQSRLETYLKTVKDSNLVACFSDSANQPLMWAHYADENKGFCAEYDDSCVPNPQKVNYSTRGSMVNLRPLVPYLIPALNPALFPDFVPDYEKIGGKIKILLFQKTRAWAYEHEWRSVIPNDVREANIFKIEAIPKAPAKFLFKTLTKPTAIYVGSRCEEKNVLRLVAFCRKTKIPCYRMKLNYFSNTFSWAVISDF